MPIAFAQESVIDFPRIRRLNNWWRSLLSLTGIIDTDDGDSRERQNFPAEPRKAAFAGPADAVHDMLNTWLVEKKPENILSYFADESYYCVGVGAGKIDHGMAKFKLLNALQQSNQRFGNPRQLADISTAVSLGDTAVRIKSVKQSFEHEFTLYDVRETRPSSSNARTG